MGKQEGFGTLEFLLWVSENQARGLVLAVVAEILAGGGAGVGGDGTGFSESCGKDFHFHSHADDYDYGW